MILERPRASLAARARVAGATGLIALFFFACPAAARPGNSLQAMVDAAPPGSRLEPPAGRYEGTLVIRRPIVLDGRGVVTIDAGGKGSVVELHASKSVLRGLRFAHSGASHDTIDSGVQVRGKGNRIEGNDFEDCLFGIDLQQADENVVTENRIRSKPFELGLRGDSVRLWYSRGNSITRNDIRDVRDMVVWYSEGNTISGNRVRGSRYGLHFMYSKNNRVEDNLYEDNSVGVFLMYSDGLQLRRNRILRSAGPTGMGVGFKESSDVTLEDNLILGNSRGLYLDISPYQPDMQNRFRDNRIAYNGVGVLFHSDWHGNVFEGNDFAGNFTQVAVDGGGGALRNDFRGNHWDDYRGFDRDEDGRGDTPYESYAYADRIGMDLPSAAFLRGSPLFEVIDFLDRLAPFSEPTLVVRDSAPLFELRARTASQ